MHRDKPLHSRSTSFDSSYTQTLDNLSSVRVKSRNAEAEFVKQKLIDICVDGIQISIKHNCTNVQNHDVATSTSGSKAETQVCGICKGHLTSTTSSSIDCCCHVFCYECISLRAL